MTPWRAVPKTHGLTDLPNSVLHSVLASIATPLSTPPLGHLLFPHQGAIAGNRRRPSFRPQVASASALQKKYPEAKNYKSYLHETQDEYKQHLVKHGLISPKKKKSILPNVYHTLMACFAYDVSEFSVTHFPEHSVSLLYAVISLA